MNETQVTSMCGHMILIAVHTVIKLANNNENNDNFVTFRSVLVYLQKSGVLTHLSLYTYSIDQLIVER